MDERLMALFTCEEERSWYGEVRRSGRSERAEQGSAEVIPDHLSTINTHPNTTLQCHVLCPLSHCRLPQRTCSLSIDWAANAVSRLIAIGASWKGELTMSSAPGERDSEPMEAPGMIPAPEVNIEAEVCCLFFKPAEACQG